MLTEGYKTIRDAFRMDYDPRHDAWGHVMEWHFAIAEVIIHKGMRPVPADWEFHDSPMHRDEWTPEGYADEELAALRDDGIIFSRDLIAFGNVLSRYADILRAAGKDY